MGTRLTLTQRLNQEIGGDSTLPTTTIGQTGELGRYVNWIDQAWVDIQEAKRSWRWMVTEATGVETIAIGDTSVTLLGTTSDYDELRPYDPNGTPNVLFYQSSVGVTDAQPVELLPWSEFNGFYDSGQWDDSSGRPQFCSLAPNGTLRFYPKADVAYKIKYQYRKTLQTFTADATSPSMPSKFHQLVVWVAMGYYGGSADSNSRILAMNGTTLDASGPGTRIGAMYRRLCQEQMPDISYFGGR